MVLTLGYGVSVVILFSMLIEVTFSYTNPHEGGHKRLLENLGFNEETTNTTSIKHLRNHHLEENNQGQFE